MLPNEFQTRIKVLEEEDKKIWHWRDAQNLPLCDRNKSGVLTPFIEVSQWDLCIDCKLAVQKMAEGWK